MVVADVAPTEPVCSASADALERLLPALGLPAEVVARMRVRLASLEMHGKARTLVFEPATREVSACSPEVGLGVALAVSGPRGRELDGVVDVLCGATNAGARIVERLGPSEPWRREIRIDLRPLGLAAWSLVESALAAAGLRPAWHRVLESVQRGPWLDACVGLALQLDAHEMPHLEIRIDRHDVSGDLLLATMRGQELVDPRRVARLFHRLVERASTHRFAATTSWSFAIGGSGEPSALCLAVPIRAYARHDADACARIDALQIAGDGARIVRAALSTLLARGLEQRAAATGIELQWRRDGERVLVEVSPDAVDDEAASRPLAIATDASPWAGHPLLARLERGALSTSQAWTIVADLHGAVVEPSARRMASLVARVDDDVIRSLLAHELAAELGDGDAERGIARGLRRALELAATNVIVSPTWSARIDAIVGDAHPHAGVGAVLALRRLTHEVVRRMSIELDRCGHAELAARLAALARPPSTAVLEAITHESDRRAAQRGERAVVAAVWTALDDLDRRGG